MAQYTFHPEQGSPYSRVVPVDGYCRTDNNGAVITSGADFDGTAFSQGRLIKSIVLSGTGLYQITLEQPFFKLLSSSFTVVSSATIAGSLKIASFNTQGATVAGRTAQRIDVQFEQSGSPALLRSGGFFFAFRLLNDNIYP